MHCLDVDSEVWREVPHGAESGGHGAGRERGSSSVVDGYPVRRGKFVPVECGGATPDHRPCVRVSGRLSRKVPSIELLESGIDVVEIERYGCNDPALGIDLANTEQLADKRLVPLNWKREAQTHQVEPLTASRQVGPRCVARPQVGDRTQVCYLIVSTTSHTRAHHPASVVLRKIIGQDLPDAVPFASGKARKQTLRHADCRVFQSRRLRL